MTLLPFMPTRADNDISATPDPTHRDAARMQAMLTPLADTPSGGAIIARARAAGLVTRFDPLASGNGYLAATTPASPWWRVLAIRDSLPVDEGMQTVAHELGHVTQHLDGLELTAGWSPGDYARLGKLLEAGAQAQATRLVWEVGSTDPVAWQRLRENPDYGDIAKAYETAMTQGEDPERAAFMAWFERSWRPDQYDRDALQWYGHGADSLRETHPDWFSNRQLDEATVSLIGQCPDGRNFLADLPRGWHLRPQFAITDESARADLAALHKRHPDLLPASQSRPQPMARMPARPWTFRSD